MAYVAGVAGVVVLSLALRGKAATAGVARWALPIALVAAVALIVQFAAFGAPPQRRGALRTAPAGDRTGDAAGDPTLAPAARRFRRGGTAPADRRQ